MVDVSIPQLLPAQLNISHHHNQMLHSYLVICSAIQARAASESSSKRASFDRITNCQEFWSIEMGHLAHEHEMGIELRRFEEEAIVRSFWKMRGGPDQSCENSHLFFLFWMNSLLFVLFLNRKDHCKWIYSCWWLEYAVIWWHMRWYGGAMRF